MYRVVILLLFTNLFFMLHSTGNITKYINMKYAWLSYSMIYILFFLTIAEGIRWYLSEKKKEKVQQHEGDGHHDHHCDCRPGCHDDGKGTFINKKIKKYLAYSVVLIPALSGVLLPVATLDSMLVDAKGFSFPALDDGDQDQYSMHQVLNPDMSKFMNQGDFQDLLSKDAKSFLGKNSINFTDDDYLKGLEVIYNYSGAFIGKPITIKGFSYNGPGLSANQLFLLRFGIIHCLADSGAYGMMIQFPNNIHIPNDQWFQVTGTVDTVYYPQMKTKLPVLKVTSYKTIPQPQQPYIVRNLLN